MSDIVDGAEQTSTQDSIVVLDIKRRDIPEVGFQEILDVPIGDITPMKGQPRFDFNDEELVALSDFIKDKGQLQPGVVMLTPDGPTKYELVDGERRYRAALMAGKANYRAIVIDTPIDSAEQFLIASILNFNRKPHNAYEEVMMVQRMAQDGYTQDQIAHALGKKQAWVSQRYVISQRMTEEALDVVRKKDVPISVALLVSDYPREDQASISMQYARKEISRNTIALNARQHRSDQGRTRNWSPNHIWRTSFAAIKTLKTKYADMSARLPPDFIQEHGGKQGRVKIQNAVDDLAFMMETIEFLRNDLIDSHPGVFDRDIDDVAGAA